MTPEEAEARVEKIRQLAWDAEVAHSKEDDLYSDFAHYVASINLTEFTVFDVAELVRTAFILLETEDIDFPRWCG